MSWWKSLLDKVIEAVASWGRSELTKERPDVEPSVIRTPPKKVGKRVQ